MSQGASLCAARCAQLVPGPCPVVVENELKASAAARLVSSLCCFTVPPTALCFPPALSLLCSTACRAVIRALCHRGAGTLSDQLTETRTVTLFSANTTKRCRVRVHVQRVPFGELCVGGIVQKPRSSQSPEATQRFLLYLRHRAHLPGSCRRRAANLQQPVLLTGPTVCRPLLAAPSAAGRSLVFSGEGLLSQAFRPGVLNLRPRHPYLRPVH